MRIERMAIVFTCNLIMMACDDTGTDRMSSQSAIGEGRAPMIREMRRVTFAQPESSFVVFPTGIDVSADGDIVIADASEGNVKWYDRAGGLKRILGRKGGGPGEFRLPYFPRFAPDGGVIVVDIGAGTVVSSFGADGVYLGRSLIRDVRAVGHVEIVDDSTLVFAARAADPADQSVLFVVSRSGTVLRKYLPIRDVLPTGGKDADLWRGLANPSFALRNDTAFVVMSTSDSLWTVDLRTGDFDAVWLRVPERGEYPEVPEAARRSQAEFARYFTNLFVTTKPVATSAILVVPFVRGVYLEGGEVTNAVLSGGGGWVTTRDWPVIQRAINAKLYALIGPVEYLTLAVMEVVE